MNLKIWHLLTFAAVIILLVVALLPNRRDEGILLARSGKVSAAAELLEPVIRKNPRDYRAVIALAEAYNSINEPAKAGKMYVDYLRSGGADTGIRQKLLDMYIGNYQYQQAIDLLREEKDPDFAQLIQLSVRMGDIAQAVRYSREKLRQTEDKSERLQLMRDIETYERWRLNMPGVAQSLEELAELDNTLENNLQALDFFIWKDNREKMQVYAERVMRFSGLSLKEWRILRTTWLKLRNLSLALQASQEAAVQPGAVYSDWADYLTLLGWAGKTRKLQEVIAELLPRYPQNSDLYYKELALLSASPQSLRRAELDEKLYELTADTGLLRDAVRIYKENKKNSVVAQIYADIIQDKKFIAAAEKNIRDAMLLAEAYQAAGKKDEAQTEIARVYASLLKIPDKDADQSLFYAAIDFARQSGQHLVQADLSMNLYRLNGDLQLLKSAVALYQAAGRDAEFLDLSRKLLAAGNISPGEELEILRAYLQLGLKTDASKLAGKIYQNVLGADIPENFDPYWVALAAADAMKNTRVKAEILQKFFRINSDPGLLREAAEILSAAGEKNKAITIYQELENKGKLEGYDTAQLLELYKEVGRKKELDKLALQSLASALQRKALSKEDDLYYYLLDILPELGHEREARELLIKYARGGDIEAEIALARLNRDSGALAQARADLEKILRERKVTAADRAQAELLLAEVVADEFYAQPEREKGLKLLNLQEKLLRQVIKQQLRNIAKLSGAERVAAQQLTDSFILLLIQRDFLLKDYTGVDRLVSELLVPDAAVYLELATLYYNAGEEESARRYFGKVKVSTDFTGGQYAQLGYLYAAFGENKQAMEAYKKADRLTNGLDKDIRIALAGVYGALGEVKKQYRIVDFYAGFGNAEVQDWLRAAEARAEHNDYRGEYRILQKALAKKPDSVLLIARMVSRLSGLGQRLKAVEYAKRLNGLKLRRRVEDLLLVGYALLDVGQVEEAGRIFRAAAGIKEGNREVLLARARYLAAAFRYPQAHRLYKEYLRDSTDGRIWYEYALLKQAAGFVGVREAFLKAEQLLLNGKQSAEDMALLSAINSYLKRRSRALKYAEYARKLAPENSEYALDLAELYNLYNYPEFGGAIARNTVDDGFNTVRKRALVAEAEMLSRRFTKSIAELEQVLKVQPGNAAAEQAKGYAEIEVGEWLKGAGSLLRGEELESKERLQAAAGAADSTGILLPELED